jgi:predicted ribosomally synthesized peptide with SipW-like signal peptide
MKKKGLALFLALTLLVVGVVAGTLAWLTAKSDVVTNTFTTSDIKVELKETTGTEYKMIPGYTISKNPKATVLAGSEECYLFVKLDKSASFDTYLEYVIADGWTKLDGVDGTTNQIGTPYSVLKDDQVTVKGSVTKEQMNALDAEGAVKPTLTITAYASQLHKNATETFSASEAWNNIANK